MKNLILTLTLSASIVAPLSLSAQEPKPERPKQGRDGAPGEARPGGPGGGQRVSPEERMKRMTEALGLSQEQQDKVKKIMEEGREEFGKLRDVPEAERRQKFGAAMKAQNEKIMGVLTPEQQEKYKKIVEERMRQGGGRPGGPGGPRGEGGKGDGGKRPDGGSKPEGEAKAAEKK